MALGPDHPDLATVLGNMGALAHAYDDALRFCEQGRQLLEAVHGPDHPGVATVLTATILNNSAASSWREAERGRRAPVGSGRWRFSGTPGADHPDTRMVAQALQELKP